MSQGVLIGGNPRTLKKLTVRQGWMQHLEVYREKGEKILEDLSPNSAQKVSDLLRECSPMIHFVPNPSQWSFFEAHAKGLDPWAWTGNRWGKTFCGAVLALMHTLRIVPIALRSLYPPKIVATWRPKQLGWIVVPDFKQSLDAIVTTMQEIIPTSLLDPVSGWSEVRKAWKFTSGSVIRIKSCDSPLLQFEGATKLDWVLFDEEPPHAYYKAALCRLIDRKGWHAGMMTPISGVTWSYDWIYLGKQPNIALVPKREYATIYHNPKLDRTAIDRYMEGLPEHERRVRAFGEALPLAGSEFFNHAVLRDLIEDCRDGERMRVQEEELVSDPSGPLEIFEKPIREDEKKPGSKNRGYVIGVDPSGGASGGDFAVAQVLDAETTAQVASYHAQVPPEILGSTILPVLGHYYNEAVIVVESNNHGGTVIDNLLDAGYSRLYRETAIDRISQKSRDRFGFLTTAKTKNQILGRLAELVRNKEIQIPKRRTLDEMIRLVRTREDTIEAVGEGHDDEVMSLAIAAFVATSHTVLGRTRREPPSRERRATTLPRLYTKLPYVGYRRAAS